jgi:hypothetical protein
MGYENYLVELLQPLGVYDLSQGKINREELAVYGQLLDRGQSHLEETEVEMSLTTAESLGLEQVEALLPYRPVSSTIALRRAALAALLRIGGDSFTLEAVNDTLSGCGINAKAKETDTPNYVQVWFPDVAGIPEGFEQLKVIIEEILPCQLGIEYVYWYLTWGEVAEKFSSWGALAETGMSWQELQVYVR